MLKLGVNIDHVATLREARGGIEPDPITAARLCESVGVDSIVVHLREDKRHINDQDLNTLRKEIRTRLNLEMSTNKEIVRIARKILPDQATLVPEKRQELTTEGGLDVVKYNKRVTAVVEGLQEKGIVVSLFIDPVKEQIEASKKTRAEYIELHTGCYADSTYRSKQQEELAKLKQASCFALSLGLGVNVGHGLNYTNVKPVARIPGIEELNIGHSIISRAVFVGLKKAVEEMLLLIKTKT
ncbi:pyridoxine 5'-phosphate synthase [Candidatus Omnitrophota bacterium]